MSEKIDWVCLGRAFGPRHAGVADEIPERCPHCGMPCRLRTHCPCGHGIKDCSPYICRLPEAREFIYGD